MHNILICHISVGLRANRVKVAMDAQVASPHPMMGWSFGPHGLNLKWACRGLLPNFYDLIGC